MEIFYHGNSIKTSVCNLKSKCGKIYTGKGKGLGEQSMASALFEALEHYFYYVDHSTSEGPCTPLNLSEEDSALVGGSPDFDLFPLIQDIPLSRVIFEELLGTHILAYPAFLTNPKFVSQNQLEEDFLKSSRLRRYSTNSGTASGTCLDDAILHALLELVERDALSLELLRTIFSTSPEPIRVVDLRTAPASISNLCKLTEQETGFKIRIFFLKNDLGIPVFLAELRNGDSVYGKYFGSGASLSIEYAIERSILEAVQGFHVYKYIFNRKPFKDTTPKNRLTKYQRCLLEYGVFEYRGGHKNCSFEELTEMQTERNLQSPSDQINTIVAKMRARDIDVFGRRIEEGNVVVAQIVAPKLERFFLVSEGLILAPGGRGRLAINLTGGA